MRLSLEEYGCFLTLAGKSRSEDPHTHCAAVGFSKNKRVLGISYNGLGAGMSVPDWMKEEGNREKKGDLFLHAEQNLFNLIKNEECELLCLNISPCFNCSKFIVSHGVKRVVYLKEYHRCTRFKEIFDFYKIQYQELSNESKINIRDYILNASNFSELQLCNK